MTAQNFEFYGSIFRQKAFFSMVGFDPMFSAWWALTMLLSQFCWPTMLNLFVSVLTYSCDWLGLFFKLHTFDSIKLTFLWVSKPSKSVLVRYSSPKNLGEIPFYASAAWICRLVTFWSLCSNNIGFIADDNGWLRSIFSIKSNLPTRLP